jgi:hypothetical protein
MARESVPLNVIQRQLGHANLGVTSIYLQASTAARHREGSQSSRSSDSRCRGVSRLALLVQSGNYSAGVAGGI